MQAQHPPSEHKKSFLEVQVRYLAASQPFNDPHAEGSETAAHLKARALNFFGLEEGGPSKKQYALALDGDLIDSPSRTLNELSEGKHHLAFTLLEQFTQG